VRRHCATSLWADVDPDTDPLSTLGLTPVSRGRRRELFVLVIPRFPSAYANVCGCPTLSASLTRARVPQVFTVPGVVLVLGTHAGPVRFQPLFLSQRALWDVADGMRGLRVREARLRRRLARRRFQQNVTTAAAAMAGEVSGFGAAVHSGSGRRGAAGRDHGACGARHLASHTARRGALSRAEAKVIDCNKIRARAMSPFMLDRGIWGL